MVFLPARRRAFTTGCCIARGFGGYLRHWQQYRAMPPGAKPRAIIMILLTFAISLWLVKAYVGAHPAAGDPRLPADIYVAHSGG